MTALQFAVIIADKYCYQLVNLNTVIQVTVFLTYMSKPTIYFRSRQMCHMRYLVHCGDMMLMCNYYCVGHWNDASFKNLLRKKCVFF